MAKKKTEDPIAVVAQEARGRAEADVLKIQLENQAPGRAEQALVHMGLRQPRSNWIEPNTLEEAKGFASWLAQHTKEAIPKAYRDSPGDAVAAMAIGRDLGMSPVVALQRLYVIHGKVGMDASEMRNRAMRLPSCEYFIVDYASAQKAVIKLRRRDWPEGTFKEVTVHIEDAKRAKWGMRQGKWDANSSWMKTPDDMLVARATSKACRRYFPEYFSGVYEVQEIREVVDAEVEELPAEAPAIEAQPEEAAAEVISREIQKGKVEAATEEYDDVTDAELAEDEVGMAEEFHNQPDPEPPDAGEPPSLETKGLIPEEVIVGSQTEHVNLEGADAARALAALLVADPTPETTWDEDEFALTLTEVDEVMGKVHATDPDNPKVAEQRFLASFQAVFADDSGKPMTLDRLPTAERKMFDVWLSGWLR